jgi:hypothetical protein
MRANLWLGGLAALLLHAAPLHAQVTVQTAEEAEALVSAAISNARDRLAALPPPASDSEKLMRLVELEQAPRLVLSDLDLSALSESDKQAMWAAIWSQIGPIDRENQALLLQMVPEEGWFPISRYGVEGAMAAFLIVQHADQSLWRRFLPTIEAMVKTGEAQGPAYALMYDRLALSEGRPQRYGSQMQCSNGQYVVMEPVEDAALIDERRSSVGLPTLAENLERFAGRGC